MRLVGGVTPLTPCLPSLGGRRCRRARLAEIARDGSRLHETARGRPSASRHKASGVAADEPTESAALHVGCAVGIAPSAATTSSHWTRAQHEPSLSRHRHVAARRGAPRGARRLSPLHPCRRGARPQYVSGLSLRRLSRHPPLDAAPRRPSALSGPPRRRLLHPRRRGAAARCYSRSGSSCSHLCWLTHARALSAPGASLKQLLSGRAPRSATPRPSWRTRRPPTSSPRARWRRTSPRKRARCCSPRWLRLQRLCARAAGAARAAAAPCGPRARLERGVPLLLTTPCLVGNMC